MHIFTHIPPAAHAHAGRNCRNSCSGRRRPCCCCCCCYALRCVRISPRDEFWVFAVFSDGETLALEPTMCFNPLISVKTQKTGGHKNPDDNQPQELKISEQWFIDSQREPKKSFPLPCTGGIQMTPQNQKLKEPNVGSVCSLSVVAHRRSPPTAQPRTTVHQLSPPTCPPIIRAGTHQSRCPALPCLALPCLAAAACSLLKSS